MVEGEQIYGDGVNVAARLESLADPGGICISGTVHDQVRYKLALAYEDIGHQTVKNIAHPVRAWRVKLDGVPPKRRSHRPSRPVLKRSGLLLAGIAIAIATFVIVQHLSLKPPHTTASIPPRQKLALPLPSIPSVAVLPFTNMSGDPAQDYFSDGISDYLITNLSRIPGLFVIARNSSFVYKNRAVTAQQVARELGVRLVLEGSVLRAENRIQVNVQLADAASGTNRWAQGFERSTHDIFAVQDDILRKVVTTVALLFKLDNLRVPHGGLQPTDNLEAFDDWLRGEEYLWRFTKEDNVKARGFFENAIALDRKYSDAYAELGWTYCTAVLFQWSQNPPTDLKRASELAQKALDWEDSNSRALALASWVDLFGGRPDQGVIDGRRAIALNPNYAGGYFALGNALIVDGKPEEAISTIQKATRLDPESEALYAGGIGIADVFAERYQQAIQLIQEHVAVYPNDAFARGMLAIAYSELGSDQEARSQASDVMRLNPQYKLPPAEGFFPKSPVLARRYLGDLRKAGLK
jgi:adenylate cyclase